MLLSFVVDIFVNNRFNEYILLQTLAGLELTNTTYTPMPSLYKFTSLRSVEPAMQNSEACGARARKL